MNTEQTSKNIFTKVGTNSKGRFASFKVTLSNGRVLCAYASSRHSAWEKLARGCFYEGLQIIWRIKMKEMKTMKT